MRDKRFFRFSLIVLAVNLVVILWGALVRATGSGAGCGSHWPLCNGEVVPIAAAQATWIEFTHRGLSGLALVGVGVLWAWTLRRTTRGAAVRGWAWGALALVIVEALVGAGLVLMRWVADDASAGRAASIAVHLAITYGLLACLGMIAWHAADEGRVRGDGGPGRGTAAVLLTGMLVVGVTGAITALGDTLFPAASLAAGFAADVAPTTHWLVRLRLLHPALAVVVAGGLLAWSARRRREADSSKEVRRWLAALRWALALQLAAGLLNVVLLAPVWMQIVHLFLADAAWLILIVCLAEGQGASTAAALGARAA